MATAAFVASTLLRSKGSSLPIFDTYVYNGMFLVAAVVSAIVASERRDDRAMWVLVAIGSAGVVVAETIVQFGYGGYDNLSYPSLADPFLILFYPCMIAALVVTLRRLNVVSRRVMWLDAVVSGFAVVAYVTWLAVEPIVSNAEGTALEVAVFLAIPVFDLVLIVLVVIARSTLGRSAGRHWHLILGFIMLQVVADTTYYVLSARDGYTEGGPLDGVWVVAAFVTCCAALASPKRAPVSDDRRWVHLAAPTALGLAALGLLAVEQATDAVPPFSVWLAMASVLVVGVRTLWTYRELEELATSRREALTDELTGLVNRRRLRRALADRTAPGAASKPFAYVAIDLDRFKQINDTLGHAAGDHVLATVGQRLSATVTSKDLAVRIAGDEFAIVVDDASSAAQLAADVVSAFRSPVEWDGQHIELHASLGWVAWPRDASTPDELMAAADRAMYRAKTSGVGVLAFDAVGDMVGIANGLGHADLIAPRGEARAGGQ
jgi:diguanylate cyclase (GGDEF)-like protein